jgi:ornithine decarboxylase
MDGQVDLDSKVRVLEDENRQLKNELEKLRKLLMAQQTLPSISIYSSDDGHPEEEPLPSKRDTAAVGDEESDDGDYHDHHYSSGGDERREEDKTSSDDGSQDDRRIKHISCERAYYSEEEQSHSHSLSLPLSHPQSHSHSPSHSPPRSPSHSHPPSIDRSDDESKDVLVSGLRLVPLFNTQDECVEIVAQVVDDIPISAPPEPLDSPQLSSDDILINSSGDIPLLSEKKRRIRKGQKQRLKEKVQRGLSTGSAFTAKKRNKSHPNLAGYTVSDRDFSLSKNKNRSSRKTKKKHKKKPLRRHRRRNPVVRAALEPADLLAPVVPEGFFEKNEAEKAKEVKMKVLEELRKTGNNEIELIDHVSSVEELLERELKIGKFSAFYLVNLGACVEKYMQWTKLLPRVRPMYAVKSNPDINIVRTLKFVGAGFDCASQAELEEVLSVGAHPDNDIIFANPCKGKDHILFAKEKGITRMTFDNSAELEKIVSLYPNAQLVLRILPDDSFSLMPFGTKFGASFLESVNLIKKCKATGAKLVGVSFHVGSGCYSNVAWHEAIKLARSVFDEAEKEGFKLTLLDIGGGYPGADDGDLTFEEAVEGIGPLLDKLFPPEVKVIAEPGRYFCTSCYTLAVTIISRRDRFVAHNQPAYRTEYAEKHDDNASKEMDANPDEKVSQPAEPVREVLYYLSDGLYGSFNNIVFDHAKPLPLAMKTSDTKQRSTLFGPTCDSIDVICKDIDLPEMEIGDWLYFMNMGAYTIASASSFNGFRPPNAKYLMYIGDRKLVTAGASASLSSPPSGMVSSPALSKSS